MLVGSAGKTLEVPMPMPLSRQNAGAMQRYNAGIPVINFVVPTRYTHTHAGVIDRNYNPRWVRAFTTTKSKEPRRVDMGKELRHVLLELRDERLIKAFAEGQDSIADELVFPSEVGTPLEINNFVARVFEPLLEKAGLRRIRFHDLRHTYGSLLIQGGASLAYVQRMMGHASIQTTIDTYVHLLPGGDIDFSDRHDLLSSARQNATQAQPDQNEAGEEMAQVVSNEWLGGRDSNPDTQIQSLFCGPCTALHQDAV
jgi:hypothetical protein